MNAASSLDALCSSLASPMKMRKDRINFSEYPMLMGSTALGGMSWQSEVNLLSKCNLSQGELRVDPGLQLLVYMSQLAWLQLLEVRS